MKITSSGKRQRRAKIFFIARFGSSPNQKFYHWHGQGIVAKLSADAHVVVW